MEIRLKWWTFFCTSLMFLFLTYYYGFLDLLYQYDITKISWFIILLFLLFSIRLGINFHGFELSNKTYYKFSTNIEWFVSEAMLSLGMIGTVIGFIYMLTSIFSNIDVTDTVSLQSALSTMATGMGTALWTTLVGLICSILLKIQLVLLDEYLNE